MEAQETLDQTVRTERDRYRALAERLQFELEQRHDLAEKLKGQVKALQGAPKGIIPGQGPAGDGAVSPQLHTSSAGQVQPAISPQDDIVRDTAALSERLLATETDLRDALIRSEILQRDVSERIEQENRMRARCRELEEQVEQHRADKSVMYHQGREQVILHGMERASRVDQGMPVPASNYRRTS
jgi:phage shock protein A